MYIVDFRRLVALWRRRHLGCHLFSKWLQVDFICSNLHLPVVLVTNVKHCLMTLLMHCSAAIVSHCNSFESECKPSYCNPHPCMGWIKSHWSSIWWHYCAVRKKDLVLFPWIVVRHSMNPLSVHCVILLYQLQLHFSCSMALHCF